MLFIWLGLLAILALAGLITLYVAYPHRGEDIPHAEWLSDAMSRSNQKVSDKLDALDDSLAAKIDDRRNDT
jgi:hypothetical protein